MNPSTQYFKIGLFVFLALFLTLAGVFILGAGHLFREKIFVETYLDQSVQGLEVGSPVRFRGVQVGKVEEITHVNALYNVDPEADIPQECKRLVVVIMGVDRAENLEYHKEGIGVEMSALIKAGLRARMASQGITGVMYMEVDYVDPERYPPLEPCWVPIHYYLPSVPSIGVQFTEAVDRILVKLEGIEIMGVIERLEQALDQLSTMAGEVDVKGIASETKGLLDETRTALARLDTLFDTAEPVLTEAKDMLASARTTLEKTGNALHPILEETFPQTLEGINDLTGSLSKTAVDMPKLLVQVQETLHQVDRMVREEEGDLKSILDNLRIMSINLREFSENAKQYPSQVLFGDPPRHKEPGRE